MVGGLYEKTGLNLALIVPFVKSRQRAWGKRRTPIRSGLASRVGSGPQKAAITKRSVMAGGRTPILAVQTLPKSRVKTMATTKARSMGRIRTARTCLFVALCTCLSPRNL